MDGDSINELETAMYETLIPGKPQIEVAMLIARTFGTDEYPADASIDAAVERLMTRQDVEAFGVIKRWRHSEIRRLSVTPV